MPDIDPPSTSSPTPKPCPFFNIKRHKCWVNIWDIIGGVGPRTTHLLPEPWLHFEIGFHSIGKYGYGICGVGSRTTHFSSHKFDLRLSQTSIKTDYLIFKLEIEVIFNIVAVDSKFITTSTEWFSRFRINWWCKRWCRS